MATQLSVWLLLLATASAFFVEIVTASCPHQLAYSQVLDPDINYTVGYQVDTVAQTVTISLRAQTLGWIGFGLSESGHMLGSDIVTAAVVNGQPRVEDRFCEWSPYPFNGVLPQQDKCNNWNVLCASEEDGYTQVVMTRALDTQDNADRPIVNGDMWVVFAWGSTDTIVYHGPYRGTTSINFFGDYEPFVIPSDVTAYTDLLLSNYILTADETQYVLQLFDLGTDEKQIVAVNAMVSAAETPLVDHMILHDCGIVASASPLTFLPPGIPVDSGNISPLGLGACECSPVT